MLKRKMLRDIINYKVQFLSIFLMAFIGVFIFTGLHMDTSSFETTINDYYEETNLADGWIYSNYLIDEFLEQVNCLGATTQMERQLVVDSQAKLNDPPDITLHFVENNTLSKFYLIEGKKLDINDSEGVWLDKDFADARNLSIGDEISFESNGVEIKKEIRGLGYSPEYVYNTPLGTTMPNHNSTGFAYMSHKAFPSDNITYNVLHVKFKGSPETYSKILNYRLDGYYTQFLERSNHHSVIVVSDGIGQLKSLSGIFPIMFIIISMLMLLTTMKRIISNQRTQIGILKANGFKNHTITLHYLMFGFLLVTLGSALGTIIGPSLIHAISNPLRIVYNRCPYWHSIGFSEYIILIPLMAMISVVVSYFSIKYIVNEPPSSIIKPKAPKSSNLSFVEKLKIWNKLPFDFRWNFRNIRRNKFRAIMTVVGVIGCTVLLISGFGIYEQMNNSKDWYFDDVNNFESKLIVNKNTTSSQIDFISEEVNGEPIIESSIEILKNKTTTASLLVLNSTDLISITDDNRDKIELGNDEVSISKKMADTIGVNVGDTIECHCIGDDKNVKIKIDKIHSSPFSQGLVMSHDKLNKLGLNYTTTGIVTSQHVNKSYEGTSTVYIAELITSWNQMENNSLIIISILLFFGISLSLVILYNMNLLSYTETKNDIATLKVLGFKSRKLTKILASESASYIIIGFILGVPIAQHILSLITDAFGENLYLIPEVSVTNLAMTFIIIISTSIITNLFFTYKIKKLNMADALKELER